MAVLFVGLVVMLQWAWSQARGTPLERYVIDQATVRTSVAVINAITPDMQAVAAGSRITAPGGGLNVLNGCEGTEVLFLLVAALMAYPMSWRWRGIGLLGGTALVFVLNQCRLLALFYSYRLERAWFDQLHGLIAPMTLIVLTLAFMFALIRLDQRARTSQGAPAPTAATPHRP